MAISRRRVLKVSLQLVAVGTAQLLFSCTSRDEEEAQLIVELSGLFRDLAGIETLGDEALRNLGDDVDEDRLLELIAPERGHEVLRREIRAQYQRGETVGLQGWQVSLTEARIFAVVSLARSTKSLQQ